MLVETMTDNRNRTVSELRHIFAKHGGNLGESGCVAWMFDRRGYFVIEREAMGEEAFMELALDLGVDDIAMDDVYEIFTSPEDYNRVRDELEAREVAVEVRELAMIPQSTVEIGDGAGSVLRMIDALEDQDDVQNVWANFEVDEQVLAAQ